MAENSKPKKKPVLSDRMLLFCFSAACIMATLVVQVDKAVAWSWPNNPYSPLWFLLNPLANTDFLYRVSLALFECSAFGLMIRCVGWKARPLPFKVAFVQIMVVLITVMIHWQENITVIAFAWVAWYFWPYLFMIAQKLPIGWSWNFQDAHVDCLRTCYYLDGQKVAASLLDSFAGRDVFHYFVYAIVVFAFLYPIHVRKPMQRRLRDALKRIHR